MQLDLMTDIYVGWLILLVVMVVGIAISEKVQARSRRDHHTQSVKEKHS